MPIVRIARDRAARRLLEVHALRRGGLWMTIVYELGGTPMCGECGRLFYPRENGDISVHVEECPATPS